MIVCRCNEVTREEIILFMKKYPYATLEEVKKGTTASASCGKCIPLLQRIYEKQQKQTPNNNQLRISF